MLLASLLCCSSYLSPRCLFRHMPNYAMVSQQVSFFFRVEHPTIMVYVFCFQVSTWVPFHLGGSTFGVWHAAIQGPCQDCTHWLLPPMLWVGQPYATQSAVFQPFQQCGGTYSSGGLAETHSILLPSRYWNWMHYLRSLMHLLCQCLQGS